MSSWSMTMDSPGNKRTMFPVKLNRNERMMLGALADFMQVSKAEPVRFLIRRAYQEVREQWQQ